MKITVPVTPEGDVGGHFGRANTMAVATVVDQEIATWDEHQVEWDVLHDVGEHGQHHARIVRFLRDHEIEHVIFSHMGPPMQNTISKMGLTLIQAGQISAREAVLQAAAMITKAAAADE